MLGTLQPMLATAGPPNPRHEWAAEPKLDGWRTLVYVDERVTVRTRSGRDISASLPDMAGLANALDERQAVLDGESSNDASSKHCSRSSLIRPRSPASTPPAQARRT